MESVRNDCVNYLKIIENITDSSPPKDLKVKLKMQAENIKNSCEQVRLNISAKKLIENLSNKKYNQVKEQIKKSITNINQNLDEELELINRTFNSLECYHSTTRSKSQTESEIYLQIESKIKNLSNIYENIEKILSKCKKLRSNRNEISIEIQNIEILSDIAKILIKSGKRLKLTWY